MGLRKPLPISLVTSLTIAYQVLDYPSGPTIVALIIGGVRERVAALSGSLTAVPLPGDGWLVRAELPLPALEEAA